MHAVVITEPGGPEVLQWTEVARPGARTGRGPHRRGRVRGQPGRHDAAPGALPAAAGRAALPGPRVLGHHRRRRRRRDRLAAGRPGVRAAGRRRLRREGRGPGRPAAARSRRPPRSSRPPRCPRRSAPCTPTSSSGARLAKGETLLIHGGGSGIGTTAIQLAKHAGATVAVTAGSQEKLDACAKLGADIMINYREDDFAERLMEATGGHGADVILDIIGAGYLAQEHRRARAGRPDRQHRAAAGPQGRARLRRADGQARHDHVHHAAGAPRGAEGGIVAAVAANVWPLVDAGVIRPVIHRELPMAQADEAHRIMTASSHTGKIVLRTE